MAKYIIEVIDGKTSETLEFLGKTFTSDVSYVKSIQAAFPNIDRDMIDALTELFCSDATYDTVDNVKCLAYYEKQYDKKV